MNQSPHQMKPIDDSEKVEKIINAIHDFIIKGNLAPGTEIPPERILAKQLEVSRFSLREALRVAQMQGLLEISRGRRPRVAQPSADAAAKIMSLTLQRSEKPLLDLIVAREGLEVQIARLAALNAQPSHIEAMQQTIDLIEQHKDDVEFCAEQDYEFHNIMAKASGNVVFEIMLAPVAELLRKSRLETIKLRGIGRVIEGHVMILKAGSKGDPEGAYKAMQKHLEMAEEDLKMLQRLEKKK